MAGASGHAAAIGGVVWARAGPLGAPALFPDRQRWAARPAGQPRRGMGAARPHWRLAPTAAWCPVRPPCHHAPYLPPPVQVAPTCPRPLGLPCRAAVERRELAGCRGKRRELLELEHARGRPVQAAALILHHDPNCPIVGLLGGDCFWWCRGPGEFCLGNEN